MWRSMLTWLGGAALVYVALCAMLYVFQRSLLYFPQPARVNVPSLRLSVPGAELHVSVRERDGPGAVIYLGGNAEDVSASLAEIAASFPEQAVYALHYRGYGRSTGSPSEAALQADVLALYDQVARQRSDVTVVGRSLGSGLAVSLAAVRPLSRLVLVTPYDSIEAVAAQQYAVFPVRWLIKDRFDAAARAPQERDKARNPIVKIEGCAPSLARTRPDRGPPRRGGARGPARVPARHGARDWHPFSQRLGVQGRRQTSPRPSARTSRCSRPSAPGK